MLSLTACDALYPRLRETGEIQALSKAEVNFSAHNASKWRCDTLFWQYGKGFSANKTDNSPINMSRKTPTSSASVQIDPEDIARFDALALQWWDVDGPMQPLHAFTPVRMDYIVDCLRKAGLASRDLKQPTPLSGVRMLDIGCGGGLLAEPCARLGAEMTAIDASEGAISAARHHSQHQGLSIAYHATDSTSLSQQPDFQHYFDCVYASEVIEHVASRADFLASVAQLVKPGGLVILTTINQSLPALIGAKIAAEYLLGLVPRGTHDFAKFIRPRQLARECADVGIEVDDITGFVPRLGGGFARSSVTAINYGLSGRLKTQR